MKLHGRGRATPAELAATAALIWALAAGEASAAGAPSHSLAMAGVRQGAASGTPGGAYQPSGPMDVELANVGFRDLPAWVEAGQAFEVRIQAPGGATCSGQIAYLGGQWQSLDEAGARVGPCAWDVTVPVGTRPGSASLAADIARGGQGRRILGVVYVSTATVGEADGPDQVPWT